MATAQALPIPEGDPILRADPPGALAVGLIDLVRVRRSVIHVASAERRAEALARVIGALAPDLEVVYFPPWDCLPYDRASPSRAVMGQRAAALGRLAQPGAKPRLLVSVGEALIQRVPPRETWDEGTWTLRVGQAFDPAELEAHLSRTGYVVDDRVDEPGEVAFRGEVIDICPGAAAPCRVEHEEGLVTAIRSFDPVTQRTTGDLEQVIVGPASEVVFPRDAEEAPPEREPGMEHRLADHYPRLATAFDYLPEAAVVLDARAEQRLEAVLEQIGEAPGDRAQLSGPDSAPTHAIRISAAARLYLDRDGWSARLREHEVLRPEPGGDDLGVPRFAMQKGSGKAFAAYVRETLGQGRRLVLAAAGPSARTLHRRAEAAAGRPPEPVADWDAARAAPDGSLLALSVELDVGFVHEASGTVAVSAADLLGSRVRRAEAVRSQPVPEFDQDEFRLEDAVVHLERGMGVLKGIEALQGSEADASDVLRLAYAGHTKLLVPVDEIGQIWRYGAEAEAVTLDRLDGEGWEKRRAKVEAEIAETARKMVELARERDAQTAPKLDASGRDYERFVLRFPFSETPDQTRAIEEVLADLRRGRPMDRLVVGDVGYGKTEVALRAAAAAALSGKQVAVAAPTTVLVRQHLATFRRRFAGLGIEVAGLSRLVKPAEAKAVRAGLKDGSIRIVVGTHALAAKGVAFADLGLVIIDEEQRFGAAHKAKLRDLARGVHVLTLTATPIPRTLLSAMVGIQDVSVIATPPARRRPIRTFIAEFDPVTVREALVRENRRGGQSFVVCPRIEDIEPLRERLAELVPDLRVLVAHGGLPADEVDATMVRFADGDGDVLLATNIIESGLDVPRANTILVWRADRFGLAQLHQVRGRVGRGRAQGVAYLLTEPGRDLAPATRKRLETLATLDRLGAGFALSARDLDIRGAGDLLGEEQAGHMKLIGAGLYRHLLQRALTIARGEEPPEDWTPEVNIGATGSFPEAYVPEPDLRINLYARLFAAETARDVDGLADEIEDRFGPLPDAVSGLLARVRLGVLCRQAGVGRLDAGPQAIALTFRPGALAKAGMKDALATVGDAAEFRGERLVVTRPSQTAEERQRLAADLLDALS